MKPHPFNGKNSTVWVLLCIYVSFIAFLLTEVNTFVECTDILFRSVTISSFGMIYEIIVSRTNKLFEFINRVDETVQTSA